MPRYRLTLEYDGTNFVGWQLQKNGLSVQEAVEKAIYAFTGQPIRVHGSSRTDSGVHARGQTMHCDLPKFYDSYTICRALNAFLRPHPVSVLQADLVDDTFHARFSARGKRYCYTIFNRRSPPTIDRHFAWYIPKKLDWLSMQQAALCFLGEHDFTSFRDSACQGRSPIKVIHRFDVLWQDPFLTMTVEGRSFLHHQIRNMVGTLALIGKGHWTIDDLHQALLAKDRRAGGPTAPAQGLCLEKVFYD